MDGLSLFVQASFSGASTSSASMPNPSLDFFPGEWGARIFLQVLLSPVQFLFLPLLNRDGCWIRGNIIP